ncbi:MAG: hypothetical protein AAF687_09415 [Pseudomonadota bacterium]
MKKFAIIAAVAGAAFAAPVAATPPNVMTVEDQAFGLSEDELFVLRTTSDNLGSYFEARHETFLVAIALDDGAETYWPVNSVSVTTVFGEEGEDDRRELVRPDGAGHANPFDILAERGGLPWRAVAPGAGNFITAAFEQDETSVTVRYEGLSAFTLGKSDAVARVRSVMDRIAAEVPDYPSTSTVMSSERFASRMIVPEMCRYSVNDYAASPLTYTALQLVQVTCGDGEDLDSNTVLIPVRAEPPER